MEISTLLIQICHLKPQLEMLALNYTSDLKEGDELVQQTLIAALYKASEFPESGQSINRWLYGLMKDIAQEHHSVPMEVIHNLIDSNKAEDIEAILDCRESLEKRIRLYEEDLDNHPLQEV
jgi:DNA-directed RNA polymerase specialized sigma24 family protein